MAANRAAPGSRGGRIVGTGAGELEGKSASLAQDALQLQCAPEQRSQPAGDGQPQTRAAKAACRVGLGLREAAEDVVLILWRDTNAAVLDRKLHQHGVRGLLQHAQAQDSLRLRW